VSVVDCEKCAGVNDGCGCCLLVLDGWLCAGCFLAGPDMICWIALRRGLHVRLESKRLRLCIPWCVPV